MSDVRIRQLTVSDLHQAATLHRHVLDMEFLSKYGAVFMRTYYRAWIDTPGSLSLAAVDERGELVGVLLGATDPAVHFRAMLRHYGLRIGYRLGSYALAHPALAKELVVTRGRRYVRGVRRLLVARIHAPLDGSTSPDDPSQRRVGEVTHVFVKSSRQGEGIGRTLLDVAIFESRQAGVQELTLVTPPDLAARRFYERLGWQSVGERSSQSGEIYVQFRLDLDDDGHRDAN